MERNRRLLSGFALSITLILAAVHPIYAAAPMQLGSKIALRIEPATVGGNLGDQVMVEIIAENASDMAGLQFEVVYDTAVARAVSTEHGTISEVAHFEGNPDAGNSPASLAIASDSFFGAANQTVTLAKITFDLVGRPGATTDLVLDQVIISDMSLQSLPFSISNAQINIAANDNDRDPLKPTFALYQDPADGAAGVTKGIARIVGQTNAQAINAQELDVLLGSFQVPINYDGSCVNILGARGSDFTVFDVSINNSLGEATFNGSSTAGVAAPADLGHVLTRLVGSASRPCSLTMEIVDLRDVDGNTTKVEPASLTLELLRGDARADGVVNIADAMFIAQSLAGSRADCTAVVDTACRHSANAASAQYDGAIDQNTFADALAIAQYLVGSRDEFYNPVP